MSWVNPDATRDAVLDALWGQNGEIIFYDLETTGLKATEDYIIQIGALKCRVLLDNSLEITDKTQLYIRPPFALPEKITEITGITDEFLTDKPSYEDVWDEIHEFFGDNPVVSGYNNTSFDDKFMQRMWKMFGCEFTPAASVDVLKCARERVPKKDCSSHKLCDMAAHFGVDDGITFHDAMDDITATKRLFDVFASEYIKEYSAPRTFIPKAAPSVRSISFWEGFRGFSRIYVETGIETGITTVYYDIRPKVWECKDKEFDMNRIDMCHVESEVLRLTGCETMDEFARFKGSMKF